MARRAARERCGSELDDRRYGIQAWRSLLDVCSHQRGGSGCRGCGGPIAARAAGTIADAKGIGRSGRLLERRAGMQRGFVDVTAISGVIAAVCVAAARMCMRRGRYAERHHPGKGHERVQRNGGQAEPCRHPPCPDLHPHSEVQMCWCRPAIQRERAKYSTMS